MNPSPINILEAYEVHDDFLNLDTVKWTTVDDGGTGTNTANSAVGGEVSIVTAAADNDYHFMKETGAGHFKVATGKPIWFTARVTLTQAATNAANFVFGISSVVDSTLLGNDGGGPPSSYSGFLFFMVDGSLYLQFETSNATTQTTNSTLLLTTSGRSYQCGFHVDSGDGTTAIVTPWVYDETAATRTVGTPHKVALASIAAGSVVYGVKAGSSSAETLKIDYIRAVQKR